MSLEEIVPMVPLSSLMLHCNPQRAGRKVKHGEGRREDPSFLPQPQLARNLAGMAGRMLCPPSTTCLLCLAGEPGRLGLVLQRFLLPGRRRESCLKGTTPDRRVLLKPHSLYKPPHLWFHSAAIIVEVTRMMFYPMWSKFISYLCRHQRGYENQAFVAKIQINKMGSECWIQQFNLGNQWDELTPENSNKMVFVVFLSEDLEYLVSQCCVFAVGVWEAYTSGRSSSDTIYPLAAETVA